jgi:hypothetical protein
MYYRDYFQKIDKNISINFNFSPTSVVKSLYYLITSSIKMIENIKDFLVRIPDSTIDLSKEELGQLMSSYLKGTSDLLELIIKGSFSKEIGNLIEKKYKDNNYQNMLIGVYTSYPIKEKEKFDTMPFLMLNSGIDSFEGEIRENGPQSEYTGTILEKESIQFEKRFHTNMVSCSYWGGYSKKDQLYTGNWKFNNCPQHKMQEIGNFWLKEIKLF